MQLIPKIFHLIWLGGKPLPKKFQKFQETWKFYHPNWNIKVWDESSLDDIPWFSKNDLKLCKNYAEQADFIRFFIIQEYGGVYIDTDFECLQNIEPLLKRITCFLSDEKMINWNKITNAIFGAIPKHFFIKKVCNSFPERLRKTKNWNKYNSHKRIWPFFLNSLYSAVKEKKKIKVFSYKYFCPVEPMYSTWNKLYYKEKDINGAYAIHHYASSWISLTSRILRFIWNTPFIGQHVFFFVQKIKYILINKIKKLFVD